MRRIESISRVQQLWWCSALIQDIHLVAALTGAFLAAIQTLFKLVPRLGLTSLGFLAPKIIHLLPFGYLKPLEAQPSLTSDVISINVGYMVEILIKCPSK